MTKNVTSQDTQNVKTSRRRHQGVVVKTAMQKTIVVRIDRRIAHSKYGKYFTTSKTFKVHDEHGKAKVGDTVEIEETRPISKEKRWRYLRTIRTGS